jgi:hypothetical protein
VGRLVGQPPGQDGAGAVYGASAALLALFAGLFATWNWVA